MSRPATFLAAITLNAALAHPPRTVPAELAKHPAASRLRWKSHALLLDTAGKRRFRSLRADATLRNDP